MRKYYLPPPLNGWITSEDYFINNPRSLYYSKQITPFPFAPSPITHELPAPWSLARVFTIPEGKAFGPGGIVVTKENLLLSDISLESDSSPTTLNFTFSNHSILKTTQLPEVQYFDGLVAELGGHDYDNYYHWMIDIIPRIGLLIESGIEPDWYHISINKQFQNEVIKILNIEDKIISHFDVPHIQAKELIVSTILSMPKRAQPEGGYIHCVSHSSLKFLREKILSSEPIESGNRIFIIRNSERGRNILNEEEVIKFLEAYDFIFIEPENYPVVKQAELFASAEIIVASHGAALTNLAFCQPGTKIVEFSPSNGSPWSFCFWAISQQLGLDHRYMICEEIDDKKNLFVDTVSLKSIIDDVVSN